MSTAFAIDLPDDLLARVRAGELSAQERLYRLFERPAYTLALRVLGNPDDARETLHDALLTAFDRLGQYRGQAPFWAWLRQIVANAALMRLRQRRRLDDRHACLPDDESLLPDPVQPGPSLLAEGPVLQRALAALPDVTRSVVWLYCVEGYSHPEIAGLMGQSVSFSKSQLARGLTRLRRLLAVEEVCHAD